MPTQQEPIAIIGSACRFPGGASSPTKLWELLKEPKDVLRDFARDRLNLEAFHHSDGEHHGATDVCSKGYILEEDSRLFDASFFNINPAEADAMDPQQRLTLETVYESLESAGYTLDQIQGSLTSVFLGVMTGDYHDIQQRDPETINRYHATGTSKSILSNRVSYYFDLRGPSITMDTACSSSLAALHLAVQSLRNGESSTAIAIGVNLIFDAAGYVAESKLHMLSPTSRSRMWDAGADGYARGEGVASVVLKPLSAAVRDGDHIESVIRETGMNSDGRTTGITMPSSAAQATLIRRTYYNAGLDPIVDRPQYFEAHGTGTLAGDPVEARAIRESFFSPGTLSPEDAGKLFCGSIKTVIGHTEGCAGLAGLLKVSLALQNHTIPPNLLFNTLNPAIKPFYDRLCVPTTSIPWPKIPNGPRRASLNSFGFGGTNVHAIIESYTPEDLITSGDTFMNGLSHKFVGPLVVSSERESSLAETVGKYADFIKSHPDVDLEDLALVSQTKRSLFSTRAFFSGETRDKLIEFLEMARETSHTGAEIGIKAPSASAGPPAILGIFTGQGAQWASMGRLMIESSYQFRQSIMKCEDALRDISDAPSWSLVQELTAPEEVSRIGEAAISQPLCTAIQIAVVDVLAYSGVRFDSVVGHSSGEIAAVYAAGIISATDAMKIAYYRGLYAKLALSQSGARGSMMAIGLGFEDAMAFCDEPQFKGRIGLAASNSPTSTTLSGDEVAINEAKAILEEQKTFTRLLKVDTAYHSHHMMPCAKPYLAALKACNIKVNTPSDRCVWISSVHGHAELLDDEASLSVLSGQYWIDNMVRPVLFSEATECSLWRAGPFNLVLEIGPHPALKGPASQTMKTALGHILPYATFLRRGYNDVEAFSGGIGYIWSYLGSVVDFSGYRKAMHGPDAHPARMLKGLPSYAWHHDKIHWKEARLSRRYRLADKAPHELLGRRTIDDSETDLRWRNILKLSELPWVRGHVFQGLVLFPTSGYMAMAIQAAMEIADSRPVKFIEIRDLVIPRALTMEENHPGVESVFSIKRTYVNDDDEAIFRGEFSCHTCSNEATGTLERNCAGSIIIDFGEPSADTLPSRAQGQSGVASVDTEEYYSSLLNIGLNYQGLFRGIKSVNRTMGYATTKASWNQSDVGDKYVMHPGPLDVAFHSIIAAFCTPLSGALWAPYLPVKVDRLALTPNIDYQGEPGQINFDVDTFVTRTTANTFEGDVHIIGPDGRTGLQAEGLTLKLFTEARPSDDRPMFSKTVWKTDVLGSSSNLEEISPDAEELALAEAIDRTSLFFIKKIFDHLSDANVSEWKWFHKAFFNASKACLQETRDGTHPTTRKEWLEDSEDLIMAYKENYSNQADIKLIHAVANNVVDVMTADVQLLEIMLVDNMLSNLYTDGRAMKPLNNLIAELVENLSHKHPRMDILEIGAGTGGTTHSVLSRIGDAFGHYTYTDISAGFFENAKKRFEPHNKRITYKVLDIERDTTEQGILAGSQDLILASNVLHATRNLRETMANVRRLLKPGGYLTMMEVTGEFLQMMFLMGGLPGWWLGVDEGRVRGPGVGLTEWDTILQDVGFSGADKYVTDLPHAQKHACSVIVAQAVDERFQLLQDPLSSLDEVPLEQRLLIIGGKTLPVSRMIKNIERLTSRFTDKVLLVESVDAILDRHVDTMTSVISLTEMEKPLFSEPMTEERLSKLQRLFSHATNTLWVTIGRLDEDPFANMMTGLGRALITELPQLNLQFLDVTKSTTFDARFIVESFLKLKLAKSPEFSHSPMLWSTEPELSLQEDVLRIPRVIMDNERNDRLNSLRRTITKDVLLAETEVIVCPTEDSLCLQEKAAWLRRHSAPGHRDSSLCVKQSVSLPFCKGIGPVLCAGTMGLKDETVLAFAAYHCSRVVITDSNTFITSVPGPIPNAILVATAHHLVATRLHSRLCAISSRNDAILIYGATPDMIAVLRTKSSGLKLVFATSEEEEMAQGSIFIHKRASARSIRLLLPRGIRYVIDLSYATNDTIKSRLLELYEQVTFSVDLGGVLDGSDLLREAFSSASQSTASTFSIIPARDLPGLPPASLGYPTIVDWASTGSIPVTVRPINGGGLFSAEKTYLMVGLVSDLGRSICRWMIENGAQYIVLTSRSAIVDSLWLSEMEALGAVISVHKMDVSERKSVQTVCDTIKKTLPPIAGVCNGALVLKDQLFVEMDASALNDVFAPKVAGTIHLDEYFSEPTLDFFILFSSMSSVVGNAGQSNYNAASLFQATVANKRRAKGLAASVMSLGMVADVGYIAQRGPSLMEKLKKVFYMPISEADAHLIFAEAVVASKPENADGTIEMVSGIQPFNYTSSTKARPPWFSNSRFSHFVREEEEAQESALGNLSSVHVKEQMDAAGTEEEATAALLAAFGARMESMLQMSAGSLNVEAPLLDVGIDSLLAVEIRTWFLKEVHVDVPVLKTLSGDNARDICADAAKKYMSAKMQDGGSKSADGPAGLEVEASTASEQLSGTEASSVGTSSSEKEGSITTPSSVSEAESDVKKLQQRMEVVRTEKLSFAQSRLWFLNQFSEDPTSYNSLYVYDVKGNIQILRLRRAVSAAVTHHDALRTCFSTRPGNGEPVQSILKTPEDCLRHIKNPEEDSVQHEIEALRKHKWNLADGDVFRMVLVSHSPDDHTMLIGYHHIIMDGVSLHVFMRDLNVLYAGKSINKATKQYLDLALEERTAMENGLLDDKIDFWKREHSSPAETLSLLPFARVKSRPISESYANIESVRDVGRDFSERIKRASRGLSVTPFHFYLAGMQTLLHRLLGVEDICIGITDANRTPESSQVIGFFLNLLPIRFQVEKAEKFGDLVKKTSQRYYAAQANSGVPFDVILDKANIMRDMTHMPLFQVAMNYRQGNFSSIPLGGCSLTVKEGFDAKSPYDLAFSVTPTEDACYLQIVGRDDLYDQTATDLLLDMYVTLLDDAAKDTSKTLPECQLYDPRDVDRAIAIGRGEDIDFGWPDTLTERLDRIFSSHGDEVALKDTATALTYSQLAGKVAGLAAILSGKAQLGSRIAVLCDPTVDWVVAMLAILRAGAVYLPLDTKLPSERLAAIFEASKPDLIICHALTRQRADDLSSNISIIDVSDNSDVKIVPNLEQPGSATFILFTSGSTGTPKGIELTSAGIINYAATKASKLHLDREVVLQQSSLGFDMSIAQAFNALTNGGTLVIVPQESRGDPVALTKIMVDEGVTFTLGTPTEYLMLIRYGCGGIERQTSWRHACTGGEAVNGHLRDVFRRLEHVPTVTDCYGPTEISCCATMRTVDLDEEEAVVSGSVGFANPNTSILIIDEDGIVVPSGIPGEICVGGVGVSQGYLDSDLSKEKFTENPFASARDASMGWTTMYKTGDKGTLRFDGSLHFMGRVDGETTIKIRGLRVDLEDVSNAIVQESKGEIADAVVTVRGDPAFLVAHVVFSKHSVVVEADLQTFASTLPLPSYMKPSLIIPLDRIPVSRNGKVDRLAIALLPIARPPAAQPASSQGAKEMSLAEGELRLLWDSVLHQTSLHLINGEPLTSDSDFFLIGGTSLLLVMLQSAIRTSMGIEVSLKDMYHSSTLGEMTTLLFRRKSENHVPESIDWEAETALLSPLDLGIRGDAPRNAVAMEILMTGSTGFLGGAILSSLLKSPKVARVHCIAIEADTNVPSHPQHNKITIHTGSLLEPRLGMSPETYTRLQNTVDAVVLAGAQGHCLNNYATLRIPNVDSTKVMGLFALPRRIPLHFISSNRVTLLDPAAEAAMPPVSVSRHSPRADGGEGFTAAKWASEVFLEKLSAAAVTEKNEGGLLPVTIHRPCAVVGDKAPLEDALNALLRFSKLMGAVPQIEGLNVEGYFDFERVEDVAGKIATAVVSPQDPTTLSPYRDNSQAGGVSFRHYSSGVRVPPTEFKAYMEKSYGGEFLELDMDQWIEGARIEGIEELIVAYLKAVTERGERMVFPFMGSTL
ncbi:hypothetical protein CLIM01_09128 [Colletotrichum limetticola]|uniref:Polyketide synthase n=1 Tax=Colletotrichum limetticola TaxID=1209924 RepID=A0ABQ9PPM4_9PEZI|nr:hypothetical protein CLIM01_09128 [Colletotrichum limetticola]